MKIHFYIDPETDLPNIYKHGVFDGKVEDVLFHPGKEGSRTAIGQTRAVRYLRVIYVPDPEPDSVFVITAYELSGSPLKAYRRRRRGRERT